MKARVLTGLIGGVLFITFVLLGGWPFALFIAFIASIAMTELLKMKQIAPRIVTSIISILAIWLLVLPKEWFISFVPIGANKLNVLILLFVLILLLTVLSKNVFTFSDASFIFISAMYVGLSFHYFLQLRFQLENGLVLVFFVLAIIWTTDSCAYFVGRAWGKRKLWPAISPNKTIAGSIGGIAGAICIGSIFYLFAPVLPSYYVTVTVVILISIFGQIGDLVQSALKRHYGVKDAGTILPGHGGILDRFDSLIYVMPILYLLNIV